MRVTSTRVVYQNRWMRLHEDRTQLPDGSAGLYSWIEKPPVDTMVRENEIRDAASVAAWHLATR